MAKKYHPDVNANDQNAHVKFSDINKVHLLNYFRLIRILLIILMKIVVGMRLLVRRRINIKLRINMAIRRSSRMKKGRKVEQRREILKIFMSMTLSSKIAKNSENQKSAKTSTSIYQSPSKNLSLDHQRASHIPGINHVPFVCPKNSQLALLVEAKEKYSIESIERKLDASTVPEKVSKMTV